MLKIDNEEWSGKVIVEAIGEDFETVFDGAEEYTQDGRLYSGDPVGTRYGHRVTVRRDPEVSAAEWDRFYKLISAPVSAHVVELPHDQGTVIYVAKIRSGSRELLRQVEDIDTDGSVLNIWGDTIDLEIVPLSIQRGAE